MTKSMTKEKLILFDTTLRDGQQTQGVDFSLQDKTNIAQALDCLLYTSPSPRDSNLSRMPSSA